jgi:hypothetical protein
MTQFEAYELSGGNVNELEQQNILVASQVVCSVKD